MSAFLDDYLSEDEIRFITGYKQRARQAAWLRDNRWKFDVDKDNTVRVLRSYRDQRLSSNKTYVRKPKRPHFDF